MKRIARAALLFAYTLVLVSEIKSINHSHTKKEIAKHKKQSKVSIPKQKYNRTERNLMDKVNSQPDKNNSTYEQEMNSRASSVKERMEEIHRKYDEDAGLGQNTKIISKSQSYNMTQNPNNSLDKGLELKSQNNISNSQKKPSARSLINLQRRNQKDRDLGRRKKKRRRKKKKKRKKKSMIDVTEEMPYPFDGSAEEELEHNMYYEDPTVRVTDQPMFQLRYGPNGEVLENPIFHREYHTNINKDYFQLAFPKFDPYGDRLDQIKSYLNKWMDINEKFENLYVMFWKMNEKDVLNRVTVSYYNRKTKISKDYIIDVDFLQEVQNNIKVNRTAKKVFGDVIEDQFYNTNFSFTQQFDCQRIRKSLGKPKFFTCNPMLNNGGFFIPKVYTVDVMLKGTMHKNQIFKIVPFTVSPAKELEPDSTLPPKVEQLGLYDMIFNKATKTPKRDKKYRKYILKALGSEEFMERITKFEDEIDKYNESFDEGVNENVEAYQIRLKSALFDIQKDLKEKGDEFEIGYKMLEKYVEKVNVYNIKKAQAFARHRTKLKEEARTYFTMKNKIIVETQMKKIYEYLDYMRYYKDQRMEKKILAGYNEN